MNRRKVADERQEYFVEMPDEGSVMKDPFRQFSRWIQDALDCGIEEPGAMFLATSGKKGFPSGRMVLLKEFDEKGFVFYTNYDSRKGREISENPNVAVTFHWKELERQVRITGRAAKTSPLESDTYFSSRPKDSQISAVISPQSSVIPGRRFLELKRIELSSLSQGMKISRPAGWGGYRIVPSSFEFWQGREFRLHDRIWYKKSKGRWLIQRLAP
jgi:pyridoxamine 5'-phosphate oxidase